MKNNHGKIPEKMYGEVVDAMPILCVDIAIVHQGKYLLVKRKNHPEKGKWWTPGGRVRKGETLQGAVHRKLKEEVGIKAKIMMPLGYYENQWKENEFGVRSGIHTVSIVFLVTPLSLLVTLDDQSSAWKFSDIAPKSISDLSPFFSFVNKKQIKEYGRAN